MRNFLSFLFLFIVSLQPAHASLMRVDMENIAVISAINSNSAEANAGFLVGESLSLSFTLDTNTADTNADSGAARYAFADLAFSLTGSSSGASLAYTNGLSLELSDNTGFQLGSLSTPDAANLAALTSPIKFDTGLVPRVLVFASGDKADEARAAGADFVGGADLVTLIQNGFRDFDAVIATPDLMAEVGKVGRILGGMGLMPNPRDGTVTLDVTTAINNAKSSSGQPFFSNVDLLDSVLQDLINNPFANNTGNGFASTMFFDALSGSVLEGMQLESSNSTLITRASPVAVSAPGTLSIFLLAMFGLFGLRTQKI